MINELSEEGGLATLGFEGLRPCQKVSPGIEAPPSKSYRMEDGADERFDPGYA